MEDQRKYVHEKQERIRVAEETNGNRKIKIDEDDEILSQDWSEEIAINKRLPIQIWTIVPFPLTIRMEAERVKQEHFKLKLQFDNIKQAEKEANDNDIHDFKKKNEDINYVNATCKFKNTKLESQRTEQLDSIKREELLLKDTILVSANVDEKMIPRVYNHITSCNKIKVELNNLKRNTENLPKIMKRDKIKRDTIKTGKNESINHLNYTKELHRGEIKNINKARELNDKKNLVTEIAVKQRYDLQKE